MSGAERGEPSKVLVTGAGGFIGSHLAAEQSRRGRRVVALDLDCSRLEALAAPGRLETMRGDVADPRPLRRAVEGVDTVFHLAAAHLGVAAGEEHFRRVNVEALRGLVEACREAGVRRLVHCSSVGVYGRIERPPADEETPCRPEIPYERTKLEGERVLLEAHARDGFPVVILRPVWVYGPGCPRTEKLFRAIGRGRFFLAGRSEALRHSVYIRDMVEAFDLAARTPRAVGATLVVGDDRAVTVRRLVETIAALTGARVPRRVPLPALWAAALAAEALFAPTGKEPPISRRTLKFFTANTSFSIERARRLLGYAPRYDLAAGLGETWDLLRRGAFWRLPLPEAGAD